MLKLPGVTLVIAETRAHDLARRTINDLVSRVEFGGILIYSDDCWRIDVPGATYIPVKDWPNKQASGNFYYTQAAKPIQTPHALLMEWDAGLNYPGMWTDEFLNYDFIGAPWPGKGHSRVRDGMNVGNGGFMLLSKRLIDYLYANRLRFPIWADYELACEHRRTIETEGNFRWADEKLAGQFSFEGWDRGPPTITTRPASFGYHGLHTWSSILGRAETIERAKLVKANAFTCRTKLPLLVSSAPWLAGELSLRDDPRNNTQYASLTRQRAQAQAHPRLQSPPTPPRHGLKA